MAYFRCSTIGGGDGADLIVTCDSDFSGVAITCTDGTKTFTQTCPSSSPYIVTFESIPTGTWTISGTVSGQTYYAYKTITDFTEELKAIPDGSTVTPTDDIQTWLHCGNIWDKTTYTIISDVLSDTTTLLALISDNNAVDYMARSTTWVSSVVADSTAMTYIGANNYCADTLLADSTWRTAICNSTYFESVLNAKVPTMTSNTTPSGISSFMSGGYSANTEAWKAFDGRTGHSDGDTANSMAQSSVTYNTTDDYIQYIFETSCTIYKGHYHWNNNSSGKEHVFKNTKVDVSDDSGTTFNDIYTSAIAQNTTDFYFIVTSPHEGTYVRCHMIGGRWGGGDQRMCIDQLYLYGRRDV